MDRRDKVMGFINRFTQGGKNQGIIDTFTWILTLGMKM